MKLLSVGFLLCFAGGASFLEFAPAFAQEAKTTEVKKSKIKQAEDIRDEADSATQVEKTTVESDTKLKTPDALKPVVADGDAPNSTPAVTPSPMEIAFGAFQRGYYLTAFNNALPLAEKGDANAQTLIAYLYEQGLGIPRNDKTAASWYKFAANGGNREAQYTYGVMLLQGTSIKQDLNLARDYLQKAADNGHKLAKFNYAQMIASKKATHSEYQKALPYYMDAAKEGVADAQYVLSQLYVEGLGVDKIDLTEARYWLQRAALSGLPVAQLELGIWLVNGKGGEAKPKIGFGWILRAATNGNAIAQNRLARLYFTGVGTAKNPVEGAKWHIIASNNGKQDLELDEFYSVLSEEQKKLVQDAVSKLIKPQSKIK